MCSCKSTTINSTAIQGNVIKGTDVKGTVIKSTSSVKYIFVKSTAVIDIASSLKGNHRGGGLTLSLSSVMRSSLKPKS